MTFDAADSPEIDWLRARTPEFEPELRALIAEDADLSAFAAMGCFAEWLAAPERSPAVVERGLAVVDGMTREDNLRLADDLVAEFLERLPPDTPLRDRMSPELVQRFDSLNKWFNEHLMRDAIPEESPDAGTAEYVNDHMAAIFGGERPSPDSGDAERTLELASFGQRYELASPRAFALLDLLLSCADAALREGRDPALEDVAATLERYARQARFVVGGWIEHDPEQHPIVPWLLTWSRREGA
jgi:hypothetical protein